jgi:hypothetical protein
MSYNLEWREYVESFCKIQFDDKRRCFPLVTTLDAGELHDRPGEHPEGSFGLEAKHFQSEKCLFLGRR